MVQKTHKYRLTGRVFPCKYKYRITARYSALDEKHAFASLAIFDIQYLIKEWLDTCAILYPCTKHILKQSMKIVTVSVHRKWDRLVIYWHALVCQDLHQMSPNSVCWERMTEHLRDIRLEKDKPINLHFGGGLCSTGESWLSVSCDKDFG